MAEAHSRSDGSLTDPSVDASGTYESTSPETPKDSVQTSTSELLGNGLASMESMASPLSMPLIITLRDGDTVKEFEAALTLLWKYTSIDTGRRGWLILPEGVNFKVPSNLEREVQQIVPSAVTPPRPPAPSEPLPAALDLTDPEIWEMANRHHVPDEVWNVGGKFVGLFCEKCGQAFPCATRRALRATPYMPTRPTGWTVRGS
jgi:hypothetical protein